MSPTNRRLMGFGIPLALLLVIQLVPYGRRHVNPPPGASVAWDSPRTLELAKRACFDCHSNETRWPWYSHVAPVSWRVQNHVDEGREHLNFTAFDVASREMRHAAGEAAEVLEEGEMPPSDYLIGHPEARLTAAEKRELAAGLRAMFATYAEEEKAREREGGREGGRERR